jgi:hypothetical protein
MSIGATADPGIEDRLRAATPDQQLRVIDVLLTDVTTDAVLTPEHVRNRR